MRSFEREEKKINEIIKLLVVCWHFFASLTHSFTRRSCYAVNQHNFTHFLTHKFFLVSRHCHDFN